MVNTGARRTAIGAGKGYCAITMDVEIFSRKSKNIPNGGKRLSIRNELVSRITRAPNQLMQTARKNPYTKGNMRSKVNRARMYACRPDSP